MLAGLTGGVATGKTLVADEFRRLGAIVIDTDEIAREVVGPNGPAYAGVVEAFGTNVLQKGDGKVPAQIDRKALGRLVFGDEDKLKKLNSLTHPHIRRIMREHIETARLRTPDAIIIAVVPLLFEVGLDKEMDCVVVVYAPKETQVKRLMERDGMSKEDALLRINAQMLTTEKRERADYVIENVGTIDETKAATRRVYAALAEESKRAQ